MAKKLYELKQERINVISKMEKLTLSDSLTAAEKRSWEELNKEIDKIDSEIRTAEFQERINKEAIRTGNVEMFSTRELKSFRDWAHSISEGKDTPPFKIEFRVNPMLSTSNSNILNKTVDAPSMMIAPNETALRDLGITFIDSNGEVILPSINAHTAAFIAEAVCGGDASLNISNNKLSARRITASQIVSREFLAQTNEDLYRGLLNNLLNSIWSGISTDVFDTLDTDAATQLKSLGTTPTYSDLTLLEASLGGVIMEKPAYVCDPVTMAYLKSTQKFTDCCDTLAQDGQINGYKAVALPWANTEKIYFGDWSKYVVSTFGGGIEVIVDPYSFAKCGEIQMTAVLLADSGVWDKNAFAILSDVSTF